MLKMNAADDYPLLNDCGQRRCTEMSATGFKMNDTRRKL
jgi:hypothetical protein